MNLSHVVAVGLLAMYVSGVIADDAGTLTAAPDQRFVGSVTFEHSISHLGDVPEAHWQRGKIHRGPEGQIRLDLWVNEDQESPITSCVTRDRIWMVWSSNSLVHTCPNPATPVENQGGWYNAMLTQAKQTRYWAMYLLDQFVGPGVRTVTESNEEQGEYRVARLRLHGTDVRLDSSIRAFYERESAEFPHAIEFRAAKILFFDRGSGNFPAYMARQIVQPGTAIVSSKITTGRVPSVSVWTLTNVEPVASQKMEEFRTFFDPPRAPTTEHPVLFGHVMFDDKGNEEGTYLWPPEWMESAEREK